MLDKNIVILEGNVLRDVKFMRDSEGVLYCRFTLAIRSHGKDVNGCMDDGVFNISVYAFDFRLVKYIKDMCLHKGMRVSVVGRVASYFANIPQAQKRVYRLSVVARDIGIVLKYSAALDLDADARTSEVDILADETLAAAPQVDSESAGVGEEDDDYEDTTAAYEHCEEECE